MPITGKTTKKASRMTQLLDDTLGVRLVGDTVGKGQIIYKKVQQRVKKGDKSLGTMRCIA